MNKKIFFVTIPMLKTEDLKSIPYRKEDRGEIYSEPSHFPGIVMLEDCIIGNEEIKIITVRTKDDNQRTEPNYKLFKEELAELEGRLGRTLEIDEEILVEHSENRDKQLMLFKTLCSCYEENADVFMDITYGTKVTTACMFSTLAYAEKIAKSNIKGVYYGKFNHGNNLIGDMYDVRCMYEMSMIANAADFMTKENFDNMIENLWG